MCKAGHAVDENLNEAREDHANSIIASTAT